MTNVIRYPLRNISPQTLRDLQEQYPDASVQIELSDKPKYGGLTESEFWALIAQLDWSKVGSDDAVIAPVVSALTKTPLRHIYDFADILSQKLYILDGEQYAMANKEGNILEDADFNADRFLYARCCVVANGKSFFEHVRLHPTDMPNNLLFAALLRIPNQAYQKLVGKHLEHVWAYPIETFSNPMGWQSLNINDRDL
jgi:Protein of unknown function (DUF4240)